MESLLPRSANRTLSWAKSKLSGLMSYAIKCNHFSHSVGDTHDMEVVESKQYAADDVTDAFLFDSVIAYVVPDRSVRVILH